MEELFSTILWIICLSLPIIFIYWRGVASFSPLEHLPIPGPRRWPYLGNLPDVIKFGGMHNMLWEYFQRYGRVYKMGFGRRPTIVVTDPEMIKEITIKDFPKFQNRWFPEVNSPMNSFLFIAKNDQWKRIRTTLSPTFSAMKLKEVIPVMEDAANVLAGKLSEAAHPGENNFITKAPFKGRKLSRVEGSPALPCHLLPTVYRSKVVPVDRVKVNPAKLFAAPCLIIHNFSTPLFAGFLFFKSLTPATVDLDLTSLIAI